MYIHKNVFNGLTTNSPIKVNPQDPVINLSVGNFVFMARYLLLEIEFIFSSIERLVICSVAEGVAENEVAMNSQQRKSAMYTLAQSVPVTIFTDFMEVALTSITFTADLFVKKTGSKLQLDCVELSAAFKHQFGSQIFCARQQLAMDFNGTKLDLTVEGFEHASLDFVAGAAPKPATPSLRGQVLPETEIVWKKPAGSLTAISFTGKNIF